MLLATDKEYEVCDGVYETVAVCEGLEAVGYKRLVIDYDGIHNEYGNGMPEITSDFSGEVTLVADYAIPKDTNARAYRITLEDFAVSAVISV